MVAVFNQLRASPESSDDEDDNGLERSGFEDEETDDSPPIVVSPARWSQPQPLHLNFLSLNDAESPPISSSTANSLPHEILLHIFRLIPNPRDLYAVLLVNRAWCQCSVELLWHKPQFTKPTSIFKMINMLGKQDLIFPYATFIRRLNFTILGTDLSDQLFTRLTSCTRLERLTLYGCASISDAALQNVLKSTPHLVALDLTGVLDTSDTSITTLAATATRLQGINLGGCKKVTDVGVMALATHCTGLRRIKLPGLEHLTDQPVIALSQNCTLLLELDLHNCPAVTDSSIRGLWVNSNYLRELRLAACSGLTERAFPLPPPHTLTSSSLAALDSFSSPWSAAAVATTTMTHSSSSAEARLQQPLILNRVFDHLRMLDLTGASELSDRAMEGIVSNCPKIRNLVLAKCSSLTDEAIGSISKLGRHLHYLHLGHVANITDRAVTRLARACTRLRYIDLACCPRLSDMSVFELAVLPKLRRIGLVRVPHLTDQAVYSLGDRQVTLERIHLSYCENISVSAVHYLLQRLPRLTHLSLTGIPAFRRPELQQFCRTPPKEFTQNQRSAFCVYSGRGVNELRKYLDLLYHSLADASPDLEDSGSDSEAALITPQGEEDDVPNMPGAMPTLFDVIVNRTASLPSHDAGVPQPHINGMHQHPQQTLQQTSQQLQHHLQNQQQQPPHHPQPHYHPNRQYSQPPAVQRQYSNGQTSQLTAQFGSLALASYTHPNMNSLHPSQPGSHMATSQSLSQLPTYSLAGPSTAPTMYQQPTSATGLPFPLTRSNVESRSSPSRRSIAEPGASSSISRATNSTQGTTSTDAVISQPQSHGHLSTTAEGMSTLVYPMRPGLAARSPQNGMVDFAPPGVPSHDQVISSGSPSSSPNGVLRQIHNQSSTSPSHYSQGVTWATSVSSKGHQGHTGSPSTSSAATIRQWTPWNVGVGSAGGGVASPSPSPSGSAAAFALGVSGISGDAAGSPLNVGLSLRSNEPSPPSSGMSSARRTPTVPPANLVEATVPHPSSLPWRPPSSSDNSTVEGYVINDHSSPSTDQPQRSASPSSRVPPGSGNSRRSMTARLRGQDGHFSIFGSRRERSGSPNSSSRHGGSGTIPL